MIQKIGYYFSSKNTINTASKPQKSPVSPPPYEKQGININKIPSNLLHTYFVSFGKKLDGDVLSQGGYDFSDLKNTNIPGLQDKMDAITSSLAQSGEIFLHDMIELAKNYGHKEVTQIHALRVALDYLSKYIAALDKGSLLYGDLTESNLHFLIEGLTNKYVFEDKNRRDKIKHVINEEMKNLDKILEQNKSTPNKKIQPELSKGFINDLFSEYILECDEENGNALVHDVTIFQSVLKPNSSSISRSIIAPFTDKLKDALNIDKTPLSDRIHLKFYDEKAQNMWKNLAVGTNIAVIHDKGTNPEYLINSFLHIFNETPNGFGRLNKDNTKITIINDDADLLYLMQLMRQKSRNHKNNEVIIFDLDKTVINSLDESVKHQVKNGLAYALSDDTKQIIQNAGQNIKFVIISDKDSYYTQTNKPNSIFSEFGDVSLPLMNLSEAQKAFREEPKLTAKNKKHFTPAAIQKCVEAANRLEGNYPEKAQKIMEKISAYYIDKTKEITPKDVDDYINEAKELFKTNETDSSIKILFDTNIKLKNMVGTPSTKKEAQLIVDRIKDKSIGTKGFVIYSQDGSVGAGRKYTAQAIAGEAKIPYIEINAVDFGTKDVNVFGEATLTPEASMKKLFSMVKTQAETNPMHSAILFIENFEYFSIGEQVSQYHEKAMSQLIREMNKAQEQGLNIVVMGSTGHPELVGEATSKSFKFIDRIEVESPGYNKEARKEIIDYYIKKKNIKLKGNDKEQELIKEHINLLMEYSSYIEILTLLDKSKNVARERNHKEIEKGDFTEAYLQLTTGRPSCALSEQYTKDMLTSHECGHALNATIMDELYEKQGQPWHKGGKVNFITLDPRGVFGGAVFTTDTENPEHSFEHVFSGIVCDFGGNSCEHKFYGQDGSWGITTDMKMATNTASMATALMGQGKHFGKKSLEGMWVISEEDKANMNKDIEVMLKNAQVISDAITEVYADFNREFTKKYASRVGTGDCIIQREEFLNMFHEWKAKQSSEKKKEFEQLDAAILKVIDATKKGIICYKE